MTSEPAVLYSKIEALSRWENRWIACAAENAYFSKDPSTKCGAVIVDPSGRRRIAEGYNGFPMGIRDDKERLADREFKYGATIHAEMNAILAAKCDLTDHMLFTVTPPCGGCSAHIIQSGISHVAWIRPTPDYWDRWEDSCLFGRRLMGEVDLALMEIII